MRFRDTVQGRARDDRRRHAHASSAILGLRAVMPFLLPSFRIERQHVEAVWSGGIARNRVDAT